MHILTVDESASLRKPIMRRIGHTGVAGTRSTEVRDAIELEVEEPGAALESRTFDLILVEVVEDNLDRTFTPETIQSTIGPFLK